MYQLNEANAQQETAICLILLALDPVSGFISEPIMHEAQPKGKRRAGRGILFPEISLAREQSCPKKGATAVEAYRA